MRTNVPAGIRVVAVVGSGARHEPVRLRHGDDPVHVLAGLGWRARGALDAGVAADGALELAYEVEPHDGPGLDAAPVRRDPDVAPDEVGDPYQRVAAYALVTSVRGVLLTEFTSLTHVAGEWGLPGGGLDAGEVPADGVHREVWEETGQRVELGGLLAVQSSHWVGRAPNGVVEDFHAVRIVYSATCPEPSDPVVHDVGGTTGDARWFAPSEVATVPLASSWRTLDALRSFASGPS
jgi:8-oxo-dGTP diphosphatase